jgi:hypothetical protein
MTPTSQHLLPRAGALQRITANPEPKDRMARSPGVRADRATGAGAGAVDRGKANRPARGLALHRPDRPAQGVQRPAQGQAEARGLVVRGAAERVVAAAVQGSPGKNKGLAPELTVRVAQSVRAVRMRRVGLGAGVGRSARAESLTQGQATARVAAAVGLPAEAQAARSAGGRPAVRRRGRRLGHGAQPRATASLVSPSRSF